MSEEIPTYPDDLPPPTSIGPMKKSAIMSPDEFKTDQDYLDLLHDMFWFLADNFYLFKKAGKEFGELLPKEFEVHGIIAKEIKRCFYPHPTASYKNDFIYILPSKVVHDWQKEAIKKQEYRRFELEVSAWKRKELDLYYTAHATVEATEQAKSITEAKPGVGGFSIDLKVLAKKIYKWKKKK